MSDMQDPCTTCGFNMGYEIAKRRIKELEAEVQSLTTEYAQYREIVCKIQSGHTSMLGIENAKLREGLKRLQERLLKEFLTAAETKWGSKCASSMDAAR